MAAALVSAMLAAPPLLYEFRNPRHDPSDKGLHQMRALAMAADGGGLGDVSPGFLAGLFTVVGAAIGGVALWLAQRLAGKAAWQNAMTTHWDAITKRMDAMHAEERAAWQTEKLQLRGEIVNLKMAVAGLTARLQSDGAITDVRPERYGHDPLITIPPGGDAT
jgi:hypothetical protein